MRICQIIEAAGGGSGRHVLELTEGLIARGDDVTLIYSPVRADERFLARVEKIKGAQVATLAMQREVGAHDIGDAWRLYRLLHQLGPFDVIHSHSSKAGGLARMLRPLMPRTKQIYTPHAFMTMAPDASPLYGKIERVLSRFCESITVMSAIEYDHARKLGIAERKLRIISGGIRADFPLDPASAREKLGFANEEFVIGFIGRLVAQKNPQCAVEAFAQAAKRPEVCLAIVGDGPLQIDLKMQLAYYKLEKRAKFFTHHDARELIAGFDCLLCSSDYEGFPYTFLEALVASTPIVTTPVGGAKEAVIENETGFMTKDFSADQLGSSLLKIAQMKPEERVRMAAAARDHGKQFSIENMVEKTRAVYVEFASPRKRI